MPYLLFVVDHCLACEKVIEKFHSKEGTFEVINLNEKKHPASEWVKIFPALTRGDRILAYGEDIIEYLENKAR